MDIDGFRGYLTASHISKEMIDASVAAVQGFDEYLTLHGKDMTSASRHDFYSYSDHLVAIGRNTPQYYTSILRYGHFKGHKELIVCALEVLDGREVIRNLSERLIAEYDRELRDSVFEDIVIPSLGIRPEEKPVYTRKLIARLEETIGPEETAEFLNRGLRDRYEEWRQPDREKFLKSENIDAFLRQKHEGLVTELESHAKNGTLFFTQEVTQDVVDHVRSDSRIESGVREGTRIIIRKIPHMAKEYLAEKDEQKRRYFYCHCPWVKESLKGSDNQVSAVFCNCSAGFYRAYWEIVFDQPVRVDVLGSLLKGDPVCTFAVHIPERFVPSALSSPLSRTEEGC